MFTALGHARSSQALPSHGIWHEPSATTQGQGLPGYQGTYGRRDCWQANLGGFDLDTWWIPFHQGVSGLKGVNGYSAISLSSRVSAPNAPEALLIFGAGPG
jgi:hypothetical protein